MVIKAIFMALVVFSSISCVQAANYGEGEYGCGLFGYGCTVGIEGPGGYIGYIPPLNFSLIPEIFEKIFKPGTEYYDTAVVTNVSRYDVVVAEFACDRDNSCNWAKFMIDGLPSETDSYMFNIDDEIDKEIDFVVDVPIFADDVLYKFNLTVSSLDGDVIKNSQYIMGPPQFYWFDYVYGLSVVGGMIGANIMWVWFSLIFMVLMIIIVYRRKKKKEKGVDEDEEEFLGGEIE